VVMGSGVLVMNHYYSAMVRNGGGIAWSDAIFPLSAYLRGAHANGVYCLDWGYLDTLRLLSRNRLPMRVGSEQISKPQLSPDDRRRLTEMISNPDDLFVSHTANYEFFRGWSDKLTQFAKQAGYEREQLAVISDSYERPTFEVYRFRALGQ